MKSDRALQFFSPNDWQFALTPDCRPTFLAQFANVLNKFQPDNPSMNLDTPASFGNITSQANTLRQIEFGLRVHF